MLFHFAAASLLPSVLPWAGGRGWRFPDRAFPRVRLRQIFISAEHPGMSCCRGL